MPYIFEKLLQKIEAPNLVCLESQLKTELPNSAACLSTVLLCKAIGIAEDMKFYEAKDKSELGAKSLLIIAQEKDPGVNSLKMTVFIGNTKEEIAYVSKQDCLGLRNMLINLMMKFKTVKSIFFKIILIRYEIYFAFSSVSKDSG